MVWFCKLENKEKVDEVTVGGESPSAMTFRHSNWDKWCGTRRIFLGYTLLHDSMIYSLRSTDNELISLEFYLSKSSHHLKDEKSFLFYPIFISNFSINCYIQVIILKI